jgi:hypothetical protein
MPSKTARKRRRPSVTARLTFVYDPVLRTGVALPPLVVELVETSP